MQELLANLTILEIEGFAVQHSGNRYSLPEDAEK